MVKIIECPRDAMQGIKHPIPTDLKIRYLNALLRAGFDTLDFGSFVSHRAVPQMADTADVLAGLNLEGVQTGLLAIVANLRGAEDACQHSQIQYLGYPFSISDTFQLRNTHRTIAGSRPLVKEILDLCNEKGKELVIYLSMAFGNPYGDPWSMKIVEQWADEMAQLGIKTINISDTIGNSEPGVIKRVFSSLISRNKGVSFGAHFHSLPDSREEKLAAAWEQGCRRFDVALQGFGGCPFANDELVGNVATESLLTFLEKQGEKVDIQADALREANELARQVFAL